MTISEHHAPGTCAWVELNTTDAEAATRFYVGLFGWEVHRTPIGPGVWYNSYRVGGKDVAASFTMTPEMMAQKLPPRWLTYFATKSADATAATATALGGRVVKPPFDVGDVGRMAALADSEGAIFAVWQAKAHPGIGRRDEPGALRWNELMTADAEKAVKFYTGLFGLGSQPHPLPDASRYDVLMSSGAPSAGIMTITPEMGPVHPVWQVFFETADCDDSARKLAELGGHVIVGPTTVVGAGRFAVAVDPQGAHFGLLCPQETR